jgi:hypothetical protein
MLKASVGESSNLDPREAAREMVGKLRGQDGNVGGSKALFAYASCAYDIPAMLDELTHELPGVPMIGNASFTGVITPAGFTGGDGFLGAMALDDPAMSVGVAACPKTDPAQSAVELGEQVARKAMAAAETWRGMDASELKGADLLAKSVVSPLGVKDRLGDLVAIRHPMAGNDDGSMSLGNKVAKNTATIRMEASVDELIAAAGDTLHELAGEVSDPAAYLLVHCGGRRAGIGERIGEAAELLAREAGDVPFLTEFTFGEYGEVDDGCNTCGGLMLSFTGLSK